MFEYTYKTYKWAINKNLKKGDLKKIGQKISPGQDFTTQFPSLNQHGILLKNF